MKKAVLGVIVLLGCFAAWRLNRLSPTPQPEPAHPSDPRRQALENIPLNLDEFLAKSDEPKTRQPAQKPGRTTPPRRLQMNTGSPKPPQTAPPAVPPSSAQQKGTRAEQGVAALLAKANQLLQAGDQWGARRVLSQAFFAAKGEEAKRIKAQLDTLNQTLIFSPMPTPGSVIHVVRKGESLSRIARRYGVSYELIKRVNYKGSDRIRVGERLKILKGEPSIIVDKSDLTLTLLLDGVYVKQYPCCIGRFDKTPAGVFEVSVKTKNPTWYAPDGHVYRFGDPKNLLGTRWIGLREKPDFVGYGIHGTNDPSSVPGRASMGCVRLKNADVEELYDFVRVGTKVEIRE